MHINDVELFGVSASAGSDARYTLICITSGEGRQGWGESNLDWPATTLPARRQSLLAELAGRSIFDIAELSTRELLVGHDPPLRWAVETALWDLIGRTLGQPVSNLWGGAYRGQVPLAMRLSAGDVLDNPGAWGEALEHGFHHLWLVCTGDASRDAEAVEQVHRSIGESAILSLDGCCRYTPDAALRLASEFPAGGVSHFLDPASGDDVAKMCSLAQIMPTPVCLCRNIRRTEDVLAIVQSGGVSGIALDAPRLGGVLATRRAIAVATSAHLATSLMIGPSVGIASAALLHLAASEIHLDHHHPFTGFEAGSDLLVTSVRISDGMAEVPRGPGLGVNVGRDAIDGG